MDEFEVGNGSALVSWSTDPGESVSWTTDDATDSSSWSNGDAPEVLLSFLIDFDGAYLVDDFGNRIIIGGDLIDGDDFDDPITWTVGDQ